MLSGAAPRSAGADWLPVLEEVPLFRGLSRRHLRRVAALRTLAARLRAAERLH